MLPRFVIWMFSIVTVVLGADVVSGQNYPNKPIRIITSGVGGSNDFTARLIAPELTASLDQQVVVENRAGASGIIAAQTVSNAPPDGYTLLLYSGSIWTLPYLKSNVPYDPVRDFSPITLAVSAPTILVVHPSLPVKSAKELIALAKARPGEINVATGNPGASTHLAAVLFNTMAGVNIVYIPYKSVGLAMIDLLGGQVQVMFVPADAVVGHLKSSRLRALAVASTQPSTLFPDLPTVSAGLPGYESMLLISIFARAKTPTTIINRLNQEIVRVLNRADVKEKLFNSGLEVIASSPEELAATMKSDMARMRKLIEITGIRAE